MVFLYVIVAPEGGGNTRVLHEDIAIHRALFNLWLSTKRRADCGGKRRQLYFSRYSIRGDYSATPAAVFCLRLVLQSNTTRVCGLLLCATSLADICGLRCRVR